MERKGEPAKIGMVLRSLIDMDTINRNRGPVRWSELWLKLAEKHCSG